MRASTAPATALNIGSISPHYISPTGKVTIGNYPETEPTYEMQEEPAGVPDMPAFYGALPDNRSGFPALLDSEGRGFREGASFRSSRGWQASKIRPIRHRPASGAGMGFGSEKTAQRRPWRCPPQFRSSRKAKRRLRSACAQLNDRASDRDGCLWHFLKCHMKEWFSPP